MGKVKKLQNHVISVARKCVRNAKKWGKSFERNVVLSLGENCLPDDILRRNGLKSFSSPYASGRSNIEYILSFEKERFSDFLNPEYLKKEQYESNTIVVRNKKYLDLCNKYNETVINGFEFTHHDVLDDKKAGEKLRRRCDRMLRLKKKQIVFLYHHRLCEKTDCNLLIYHLNQLAEIYRNRGNDVSVFLFMQRIITDPDDRRVEYHLNNGIHHFTFYTLNEWSGKDRDLLWARCDDDLISIMIEQIKQSLSSSL